MRSECIHPAALNVFCFFVWRFRPTAAVTHEHKLRKDSPKSGSQYTAESGEKEMCGLWERITKSALLNYIVLGLFASSGNGAHL